MLYINYIMSNYTIINRNKLNNITGNSTEQFRQVAGMQDFSTNELIDYINNVKLLIKKVITIENTINELENINDDDKKQTGGQNNNNVVKLKKYKHEIIKLREQKKLYLMELEKYKQRIQELSIQNQVFNQQISQLSFSNYINSSEKNNLIDKLDFFNKSLDILTGSILTNVNVGNELLQKVGTNKVNKSPDVNITIKAEDMYNNEGARINLSDNMNKLTQQGGAIIGQFKRENKISQISNELKSKIVLMGTITGGVKSIIENIVRIINDQDNPNSLLNIKIKFESIINKFREVSEENEEAKLLIRTLEEVRDGIGGHITDLGAFENLLNKIKMDSGNFVEDVTKMTGQNDELNDIVESKAQYNSIPMVGGNYDVIENMNSISQQSENDINNLLKLMNIIQKGGAGERENYDYSTIVKWMTFFSNCRNWAEATKYKFNLIRTNYYIISKVIEEIKDTYSFGSDKTNPLKILIPIIDNNIFKYKFVSDSDISAVYNDDYTENNNMEGIAEITNELKAELPFDINRFMLGILLKNNSDNVASEEISTYVDRIININNNLSELLYSNNMFKALHHVFSLTENNTEIDPILIAEIETIFNSLQKLTYQTELYKDQADFLELKVNLLERAFTKLYWEPLEKFLKMYNYLDKDLQTDIDIIENNIKNFILGMKYSVSQPQVYAVFYNIKLSGDNSAKQSNITNYEDTFKYIIMLIKALYRTDKNNQDFRDLLNAIAISPIDIEIKKRNNFTIWINRRPCSKCKTTKRW